MRKEKNRVSLRTRRLSLGALLTALGVVLLWFGALIEVLDLSAAALASLLTVLAVIEVGGLFPWAVWGATSLLSLLLLPVKFPALLYLLFAGLYPMMKARFERRRALIAWILKLSFFNAALILLCVLSIWVLGLPDTGLALTLSVFALANAVFVLYDVALSRMISFYLFRLRPRFRLF